MWSHVRHHVANVLTMKTIGGAETKKVVVAESKKEETKTAEVIDFSNVTKFMSIMSRKN
ncbi:MAG: hypothetical protein ACI4D9_05535 [Lachnospiraceae bacterium]